MAIIVPVTQCVAHLERFGLRGLLFVLADEGEERKAFLARNLPLGQNCHGWSRELSIQIHGGSDLKAPGE
jgi:hypothetical protein